MKRGPSKPQSGDLSVSKHIEEYRQRIDKLDKEIVRLLNLRARCALAVGELKKSAGLNTYQPDREVSVLEHARVESDGPLDDSAITRLFERIIDESLRLERTAEGKNVKG
ncbi:uncharacterized protein METZ01_LOCUS317195 [marine metagenome]|uniref:Chorismate mutase domain-containing protein n=1 Tax=marine metagenome TaxID=408172 RepID=A0A382NXR1_9ZZZZ